MATLNQIYIALDKLDIVQGEKENALSHVATAMSELNALQETLNEFQVKGRESVDTLLGCMMEIDKMTGDNNG